jgi:hypothetical protein
MSFTLAWASPKINTIMKSLRLFLAITIALLVFCFSPTIGFAEMKNAVGLERGYYSPTSTFIPYDNAWVGPDPAEADSRIFSYQLGSVVLGIEGKTYAPDRTSKSGDAKPNQIVIFGVGFRF